MGRPDRQRRPGWNHRGARLAGSVRRVHLEPSCRLMSEASSWKEIGVKKAVFHWYSGPIDVLEDILNEGYFVSAAPSIAYSPEARRAMEIASVGQTLIETDSPVYYKHCDDGLKAEPKDVFCTLKHYAMLKQRDAQELAEVLNKNATKLFNIE